MPQDPERRLPIEPSLGHDESSPTRLVVGISGATGALYGIRILEALRHASLETHLVMTRWARVNILAETTYSLDAVRELADYVWEENDASSPIASGALQTDGMVVAPCSMRTVAAIANGISDNLLQRAADVTLKERRRLVLLVRETPLSVIHLHNLLRLAQAGVVITPPVPAFYSMPQTIDDLVNHTVGRVLDLFEVQHALVRRWGERRPDSRRLGLNIRRLGSG
jgi:polyprenyl P-hydroxybenzoate/phenylacrylic acid decarboxylase-like protein